MDIEPVTRLEYDIDAIINDHSVIDPVTRIEQMLSDIKDNTPTALEPVTRIETYLAKISGVSVELPEPVTRIEMYLANIAGMDIEVPEEPVTRLEQLLKEWSEGAGSITTLTGSIVSFIANKAAAIRNLTVQLEPQQDLHGQDAPYPAGGGKQLLNPSAFDGLPSTNNGVTATLSADGTVSLSGTATANAYCSIINYKTLSDFGIFAPDTSYTLSAYVQAGVYGILGIYGSGVDYADPTGNGKTFSFTAEQISTLRYRLVIYIASGTNTNGMVIKPMICLSSASNPTTFAPYSNICPITGWTGAKVTRAGKNLLPYPYIDGATKTTNNVLFTVNADGSVTVTRENTQSSTAFYSFADSSHTFLLQAGTYTKLKPLDNGTVQFNIYAKDGTVLATNQTASFTLTKPTEVYANLRVATDATLPLTVYPQIELGKTAYEPYSGTTLFLSFGETVYGGTHEFVSGGLKEKWEKIVVDGSENGWQLNHNSNIPEKSYAYNRNASLGDLLTAKQVISSYVKSDTFSGSNTKIGIYVDAGYLWVRCSVMQHMTTTEEWRAYLSQNPLEIVYELATPTEIQLTPQPISTLAGENNVWSNSNGDVTLQIPSNIIVEGT